MCIFNFQFPPLIKGEALHNINSVRNFFFKEKIHEVQHSQFGISDHPTRVRLKLHSGYEKLK